MRRLTRPTRVEKPSVPQQSLAHDATAARALGSLVVGCSCALTASSQRNSGERPAGRRSTGVESGLQACCHLYPSRLHDDDLEPTAKPKSSAVAVGPSRSTFTVKLPPVPPPPPPPSSLKMPIWKKLSRPPIPPLTPPPSMSINVTATYPTATSLTAVVIPVPVPTHNTDPDSGSLGRVGGIIAAIIVLALLYFELGDFT